MAPVAVREAQRLERASLRAREDLEQLAHLVLQQQLLRMRRRGDAGTAQQVEDAAVHEETSLRRVADHVEAGVLRRERELREVDMRGDVLRSDAFERIRIGPVGAVAHERSAASL